MIKLLAWLEGEKRFPKIYWKERGSSEAIGAVGAREVRDSPFFDAAKGPVFGGLAFARKGCSDALWQSFPPAYFFAPSEVRRESVLVPKPYLLPTALQRSDLPTFEAWQHRVNRYVGDTALEKIVCARRSAFVLATALNPWQWLAGTSGNFATFFALQITPEAIFFGATPEKLYERRGRIVLSEALAATRRRGRDAAEDAALEQELLSGEKELREFEVVRREIVGALSPLCVHVEGEVPKIVKTPSVQHLYSAICGELFQDVADEQLLAALHPTPATGGMPRKEALARLLQEEGFDRGWYAGALGCIERDRTSFAVAIRSALSVQEELFQFVGAGIVEGSNAAAEWQELEDKLQWIHGSGVKKSLRS